MSQSGNKYPNTDHCDGRLLAAFEPTVRDDDVLVSTTAKTGQTWLTAILYHLRTRAQDPTFGGVGLMGKVPWLECPPGLLMKQSYDVQEILRGYDAIPSPRVFKLHLVWDEIPKPPGSKAKVITVTRDPRDVPFSMYSHLSGLDGEVIGRPEIPPFDEYFEQWLERGLYFQFVRSYWEHREDPDFLWLKYESMKADLRTEINRLLGFLQWDVDEPSINQVMKLVDFDYMRRDEDSRIFGEHRNIWKDGANFFREGAVGRNRTRLSEQQEARLLERARQLLEPECVRFVLAEPV